MLVGEQCFYWGLEGFVMFEFFRDMLKGIFVITWTFNIGIFLEQFIICRVAGEMDEVHLLFYKMEMEWWIMRMFSLVQQPTIS